MAGLPRERREQLPHITLARPSRRGAEDASAAMEHWISNAPRPGSPAVLEVLALFTWAADRRERLFQLMAQRQLDAEV